MFLCSHPFPAHVFLLLATLLGRFSLLHQCLFHLASTVNQLSAELTIARKVQEGTQKCAAEDGVGRVGS